MRLNPIRSAVLGPLLLVIACGARQEVRRPERTPHDPTLSALSSGALGCPPNEIQIGEYQEVVRTFEGTFAGETATWSATCRGKKFYCTGSHTTQCHEALPEAAGAHGP